MARRQRVRRPVERGWAREAFSLEPLVKTTVDNVVSTLGIVMAFDSLVDGGEDVILREQDRHAEYFIEKIRGYVQLSATFGAGNTLGAIPCWWGFVTGEKVMLDDLPNSTAPLLVTQAVSDGSWCEAAFVRQVNQIHLDLAFERYGVESSDNLTSLNYESGRRWFKEFELGPVHLKRGECLYMFASQTGATDDFQAWVDGDTVEMNIHMSQLIRKKRER